MGSGTAPTGRAQRRNRRAERWTERRRWGSARGVCAHHINLCAEPRHTVALFLWLHAKTSLCRPVLDGPAAVHFFLCPNATVQSCRDTGGAGAAPRTDAAMWLKRYSGLLRLHAALLSPAEEFLLRPAGNGSHSSSLQLRSTFLCTYFSPRRPAPRTPFTFYTTGTATRCTVQATPLYSLIPVPQFTLS